MAETSVTAASTDGPAELPRVELDVSMPAVTGRTIYVAAGGNLQAAINSAHPGDEVVLQAGATFTGTITLPNKVGDGWITIRTDGAIPDDGTRATAADAPEMAKLQSVGSAPALQTEAGAHNYRIIGLEITTSPDVPMTYNIVNLGDGGSAQSTVESQPHDIVLDRVYIHGNDDLDARRGVALNSASTAIINSTISDIHSKGFDSQAIDGWNGTGPYLIQNNFLEAAGENICFGGADPHIPGALPSDIVIRDNDFYKPVEWQGEWLVKNLLELKLGERVLIEDNNFQNNWVDGQDGFAIVFKTTHQENTAPWSQTADVTFRNNVVHNSPAGINIAAKPEQYDAVPATRFTIEGNLFYDIGSFAGTQNGRMIQLLGANAPLDQVAIIGNTFLHNTAQGVAMMLDGQPIEHLVFRDNIITKAEYGIFGGSGVGEGDVAFSTYAPGAIVSGNLLIGSASSGYAAFAASNRIVGNVSDVGFVDPSDADFRLATGSQFAGTGAGEAADRAAGDVPPVPPQPPVTPPSTPTDPSAAAGLQITGNGLDNQIAGNTGNDVLVGSDGNDVVNGNAGSDMIYGDNADGSGAGNDELHGGDGTDQVRGGGGNDNITGDLGDDILFGDAGTDNIRGGDGNDSIDGGIGNDTLYGDANSDWIHGGDGDDAIYGGAGTDSLNGDAGKDVIHGDDGSDVIQGGDGADALYGDAGDDVIMAGGDNDYLEGGDGNDALYGGDGVDILVGGVGNDYLDAGQGDDSAFGGAGDDFVLGGDGNDYAEGGDGNDVLYGQGGDDTLHGNAGLDSLFGGDGNDALFGEDGNDYLEGNAGSDTVYGGDGDDFLVLGADNDVGDGGDGNDVISGDGGADTLYGGIGLDSLFGGDGNDLLYGGAGIDYLEGNAGDDTIYGGSESDFLVGGDGNDVVNGDDGNDFIVGGNGMDTLNGGNGNDFLGGGNDNDAVNGGAGNDGVFGDGGNDTLHGNDGDDTVDGGVGNDSLYGDAGSDILYGRDGDDIIDGGAGADVLFGGGGNDTFVFSRGQANGDVIQDYDGAGALAGDQLTFVGYGTVAQGASFAQIDATHWSINSADGVTHDIITISGGAVHSSDWHFV